MEPGEDQGEPVGGVVEALVRAFARQLDVEKAPPAVESGADLLPQTKEAMQNIAELYTLNYTYFSKLKAAYFAYFQELLDMAHDFIVGKQERAVSNIEQAVSDALQDVRVAIVEAREGRNIKSSIILFDRLASAWKVAEEEEKEEEEEDLFQII